MKRVLITMVLDGDYQFIFVFRVKVFATEEFLRIRTVDSNTIA